MHIAVDVSYKKLTNYYHIYTCTYVRERLHRYTDIHTYIIYIYIYLYTYTWKYSQAHARVQSGLREWNKMDVEINDYRQSAEKKRQTVALELFVAGKRCDHTFVYSRTIRWIDFRFRFRAHDMALGSLLTDSHA